MACCHCIASKVALYHPSVAQETVQIQNSSVTSTESDSFSWHDKAGISGGVGGRGDQSWQLLLWVFFCLVSFLFKKLISELVYLSSLMNREKSTLEDHVHPPVSPLPPFSALEGFCFRSSAELPQAGGSQEGLESCLASPLLLCSFIHSGFQSL